MNSSVFEVNENNLLDRYLDLGIEKHRYKLHTFLGVIRDTLLCSNCGQETRIQDGQHSGKYKMGLAFYCLSCNKKWCITRGSFFYRKRITFHQFRLLIHFWARYTLIFYLYLNFHRNWNINQTAWVLDEYRLHFSATARYRYFGLFRAIISVYMENYLPLLTVSGTVEIDEMMVGTRQRGENGRIPELSSYVFGKTAY